MLFRSRHIVLNSPHVACSDQLSSVSAANRPLVPQFRSLPQSRPPSHALEHISFIHRCVLQRNCQDAVSQRALERLQEEARFIGRDEQVKNNTGASRQHRGRQGRDKIAEETILISQYTRKIALGGPTVNRAFKSKTKSLLSIRS